MSRKVVSFYNSDKDYYEFTNFYLVPINISEIPQSLGLSSALIRNQWKTSEHLFQAAKFTDSAIIEEIYEAKTPREAYDLANGRSGRYRGNGVEGNGINYPLRENEGENWLGRVLVKVREELKTNQRTNSNTTSSPKGTPANSSQTSPENNNSNPPKQTNNENSNHNQSPEPEQPEEKENYSPNNNNDNGSIPTDNGNSDQTGNHNQPPTNPKPTKEAKNASDKLNQAKQSNDKDEIVNILNKTKETVQNSSDPNLNKLRNETEDRLGQLDKEELRKIIKEEVTKELQKFKVKTDDLSPQSKQKLEELNNNNNIEPNEIKNIRTKVLNDAGMKALNQLVFALEKVLKSGLSKQTKTKIRELEKFIKASNEYAQNAYKEKKNKVDQLLAQARNQSDQNQTPVGFDGGEKLGKVYVDLFINYVLKCAPVTQWIEYSFPKQVVEGSNPSRSASKHEKTLFAEQGFKRGLVNLLLDH
ncbi:10814_t:CDS:2 [Funneliformis geosporum]|uniref:13091_t:CDS:1 n=1 Tax=Funneliformis geosporum TaxID=1117311 RepID=A0A9W4SHS4_9GLOM|nr:13091_t:CDS:2 [Funneliformis geosporum]CAI2189102.1 10814_t:CDS:2 [Funneliformis geosporum]